jgi:hypothetical protein
MERTTNRRGDRNSLQAQYGETPIYAFHAGTPNDIASATRQMLENRIRRAHSIIWAGGKRDPLTAFDEWSKLLFAKVSDERRTQWNSPNIPSWNQGNHGRSSNTYSSALRTSVCAGPQRILTKHPHQSP